MGHSTHSRQQRIDIHRQSCRYELPLANHLPEYKPYWGQLKEMV